jgi:hypothetical protein
LPLCRGLFVLSNDLKLKVEKDLLSMMDNPPMVESLFHPTEFVPKNAEFSIKKFMNNPEKRICQIGAWYVKFVVELIYFKVERKLFYLSTSD